MFRNEEKRFEVRVRVNNRSRYRADTRYYAIITGRTFRVCGGSISSKPEDDDAADDAATPSNRLMIVMMTVTNAVYAKLNFMVENDGWQKRTDGREGDVRQ